MDAPVLPDALSDSAPLEDAQPDENPTLFPLEDGIGSVALVQQVGDDKSIVNAARVSFGGDNRLPLNERDEKLIKYLLKHQHGSPFEHNSLTFKVVAPIFVVRQWQRHRIACLTADTLVTFVDTHGKATPKLRKTMGDLYRMWHVGERHSGTASEAEVQSALALLATGLSQREVARRTRVGRNTLCRYVEGAQIGVRSSRRRLQKMRLRVLNEDTLEFTTGHVADVIDQGVQPVYRITLADGKALTLTHNHKVLTDQGWRTMGDSLGLELHGTTAAMTRVAHWMVNGVVAYQDRSWLKARRLEGLSVSQMAEQAGCSYHTIRKWLRVHELQFAEAERTFQKGMRPWNQGRTGYTLNRVMTEAQKQVIREARSGERSNFWRGGVATERAKIARWTTDQAAQVHARYDYTCQVCGQRGGKLEAHHIVPVWLDADRAYEVDNLATVCSGCHDVLQASIAREKAFAETFVARSALEWTGKPRPKGFKLLAHPVQVVGVEYLGEQQTYDLSVEGPWHNFVANGMVVHNSYNEISGRYVEVLERFYTPLEFRQQAKNNRQASVEAGDALDQDAARDIYETAWRSAYTAYQKLLELGVAKEQARGVLPVTQYTEFYFTCNLRALFHFLELRDHPGAQWEIQQYARALASLAEPLFPAAFRAWRELHAEQH